MLFAILPGDLKVTWRWLQGSTINNHRLQVFSCVNRSSISDELSKCLLGFDFDSSAWNPFLWSMHSSTPLLWQIAEFYQQEFCCGNGCSMTTSGNPSSFFSYPFFISKTQLCTEGAPSLQKLVFPDILPRLGLDMSEDHSLCPVQALKVCLARTGDKCKNKELLFISFRDGLKEDLYMNLLSVWVRKLIHHTRQQRGRCYPYIMLKPIKSVLWGLHWLSRAVWTQRSFCQPAWASHSTFSDFYFQDIAILTEDIHHLGPIPTAQWSACSKILNKLGSLWSYSGLHYVW